MTGTELYKRIYNYQSTSPERDDLMRKVWKSTPWMVDVYTGGFNTNRDRELSIREWCIEQFGSEASPIHGYEGQWQRGGATINGWTWMGFATEEQMNEFLVAWPTPEDK